MFSTDPKPSPTPAPGKRIKSAPTKTSTGLQQHLILVETTGNLDLKLQQIQSKNEGQCYENVSEFSPGFKI